jgi:hypothetical protein
MPKDDQISYFAHNEQNGQSMRSSSTVSAISVAQMLSVALDETAGKGGSAINRARKEAKEYIQDLERTGVEFDELKLEDENDG